MIAKRFLLVIAVAAALQGCSSVKNLFGGGNDDRVLPGDRENVLPPDQQTARDPVVTGDQTMDAPPAPPAGDQPITDGDCKLNDPNCVPPIDQELGTPDIQ